MKKTTKRGPAAPKQDASTQNLSEETIEKTKKIERNWHSARYFLEGPSLKALRDSRSRLTNAHSGLSAINLMLKLCHPDLPTMFPAQWLALLEPIEGEVTAALDEIQHMKPEVTFWPHPAAAT